MAVGGGIGDSYQPPEKRYEVTRRVLKVIKELNFPIFILTKSSLVERDIDLIEEINGQNLAIVAFSITSLEDEVWKTWEPRASPPEERLSNRKIFKRNSNRSGDNAHPTLHFGQRRIH